MVASLVAHWLGNADAIAIVDDASVALVRDAVRREAATIELPRPTAEGLVAAASEMAHDHLRHARLGRIVVRRVDRGDVSGVEVVAADEGDGILNPTAALDGRSTAGGLGVGLGAIHRLADEVDFDIRVGEGTCISARKFAKPCPRHEVAIFGRPHPAERISGDDAAFVRTTAGLLVLLADGLGHGPLARQGAQRLAALALDHPDTAPDDLLRRADTVLDGTRGAVAAATRITGDEVVLASVGNVTAQLYEDTACRRFVSESRVLGQRSRSHRVALDRVPAGLRQTLVLFSDGLASRTDLSGDPALLRRHPIVIAQALVDRFGRNTDDALVLVARAPST